MSRLSRLPLHLFGWYYVTLFAENGRQLLTNQTDLAAFLRILTATLAKQGVQLHGGYVAETEVHLALKIGQKTVSAFTASLCHDYALFFNRTHQESGALFRPHPRVLLIQQQPWVIRLVHHIHWLPNLRAPDCSDKSAWWSSDAVYRGRARMNGLVTSVILRSVSRGSRNPQKQDEAYERRFAGAPHPDDARHFLKGSQLDPRILGDDKFVKKFWELTGQRPPAPRRKIVEARNDALMRRTVVRAIRRFRRLSEGTGAPSQASSWRKTLTLANVCAMSRKQPLPMIRALCVSYLLSQHLATRLQAARFFGCRPETLSAGRRNRHERLFRQWFNQPYRLLFESGRRHLMPLISRPSLRGTTVSMPDEPGDESLEDRDLGDGAPKKETLTEVGDAFGGQSPTYALQHLMRPVRVPRRLTNMIDGRWNPAPVICWGSHDAARQNCRQRRQWRRAVSCRSVENRFRR
jgi:hypothetical protein